MFDPVVASKKIKDEYAGYITTLFHIADKDYASDFSMELQKEGAVAKGPYLEVSDSFKKGRSISDLITAGEASPLFQDLEGTLTDGKKELPLMRELYLHQDNALCRSNAGHNLVVTTGTGSGKTECFVLPVINSLLREKEAGTLSSGVRAILIYPMNALANDQMKRLRKLLKSYPDITFGVYNGDTQQTDQEGINAYRQIFKEDPMPNEFVSREKMRQTPPHILVTNYAMLEYMLLRPGDDLVFSGAKLRYLVLDEAHIYRGTTGMETSLLIRRLKARISVPENVQHILTSATLGDRSADAEIVRFAETLCNAAFAPDDIIRAETVSSVYAGPAVSVPAALFAEISEARRPLDDIASAYGISVTPGQEIDETLYELCTKSDLYRVLRAVIDRPMTVTEIKDAMVSRGFSVSEEDVVNIINVSSQASKDGSALIKARYHMFIRALEGAYVTINDHKTLSLTRSLTRTFGNDVRKVFECAVCDDCGRLALTGTTRNGKLEFCSDRFSDEMEYYVPEGQNDVFLDNEDEDDEDGASIGGMGIGRDDYRLCAKCGAINHASLLSQPCTCGSQHYVKVRKTERSCPLCKGTFTGLYLGYEAATAVLGTSLYEVLPENMTILHRDAPAVSEDDNPFGIADPQEDIEVRQKQFLSFSDSRSEAAYFASYMTESYKEFLRRRAIWHVVEQNRANMSTDPWEIKDFVDAVTAYFNQNRTFAEPGDDGRRNLAAVSARQAWIAVLNEMVNARRSTSLVSLGILKFDYKGNTAAVMKNVAAAYHKRTEDIKALFDLLSMDIVYYGAIEGDCNLTDDEREYIYYTNVKKRVKRCRDRRDPKNILGWSAGVRANGNYWKNGRLQRVAKVLGLNDADANRLLQQYWDGILLGPEPLTTSGSNEFFFSTEKFTVMAGTGVPIYRCNTCGKITMMNCEDRCASISCNGTLSSIRHNDIIDGNHYARLYSSALMRPLHIREHTAQLGREEQSKYQEMFVNKQLNALSCSTTFEMGVDVGDLETVFLRNVPPTPANYVQRAGRAGRNKKSAAYALTYAKLGSHDLTFYKEPQKMITGKISAPVFDIENEKVIQRHIFAVALSCFLKDNPDVYNGNDADIMLNGDGWERLCAYIDSKPAVLKDLLEKSIPVSMHSTTGINNFSWADRLKGPDGVMTAAVTEFRTTVQFYVNEIARLRMSGNAPEANRMESKLFEYRRSKADGRGRNELIEFLVRNNVLPKYGFPVDTAELHQNINVPVNGKLKMVRDLQIAVSEYAPGSQVVADGKMYTSRYLKRLPQATGQNWNSAYIAKCQNRSCGTWNYRIVEPAITGEECVSCHSTIQRRYWHKAIEPRKGFVADPVVQNVPMRKPEKLYRSDDYYIGDALRRMIDRYTFEVNGSAKVQIETSVNDSLMVVCDNDFYVCPSCGYTLSDIEAGGSIHHHVTAGHNTPWGKRCAVDTLEKEKLMHVFRTDVVKVTFDLPQASDEDTMLSVINALLEAMSAELDIERNDLKGCLFKIVRHNSQSYALIIYDAVAGGAGHVRRLATADGGVFEKVVEKAISITKGCTCSPSCYSCLRNYNNQRIHDRLDRTLAYDFLENYKGSISAISNSAF